MNDSIPPDYYKILNVSPSATAVQIREAYKREALKSHPDRVPIDSPERATRTKRFQAVNDAYYTLSDPGRRKDYDAARIFHGRSGPADDEDEGGDEDEEIPRRSPPGGWSSAAPDDQFGGVFEEMLRDEGLAEGEAPAAPTRAFWSIIGGISGGAMGFIVANMPGAIAGAVAGNRLGAIRDKKGKAVYAVFQDLDQGEKAKILGELAARVFAHAVSG